MNQEEYNLIKRFARKYLFRKYHNSLLDDLTQYLALNKWKKPNYDLRFGVIDFCRLNGLTEYSSKKSKLTQQSSQLFDRYAIALEGNDVFGEIEQRLIEKGAPQNLINEAVSLLRDKDYSGALNCFRRIGYALPVKYKYQKWDNSEKIYRLGCGGR